MVAAGVAPSDETLTCALLVKKWELDHQGDTDDTGVERWPVAVPHTVVLGTLPH